MSTTRELVDIIVDLKASISKKDAIIDKLQEYISKNSLNAGENKVDYKEYDRVMLENVELRQKLEYYEKPTPSHFDTMVGRLDDQNWG